MDEFDLFFGISNTDDQDRSYFIFYLVLVIFETD